MKRICLFFLVILLLCTAVKFVFPHLTTTLPARNQSASQSFSFAVVGDSQPKDGLAEQPEVFIKIVEAINKSEVKFVVHLGDKIYGGRDAGLLRRQYEEYQDVIDRLKVSIYHTVGNHEIMGLKENEEMHEELFGPLYYSFRYENALFIVLNSESVGREGKITGSQMSWLKDELEKGKECKYIFVFLHRPLYSAAGKQDKYIYMGSAAHREELAELFKRYGVSAVFAGHEHLFHTGRYDELLQIISGGGGGKLLPYISGRFHHFLIVDVTEENAVIRALPVN